MADPRLRDLRIAAKLLRVCIGDDDGADMAHASIDESGVGRVIRFLEESQRTAVGPCVCDDPGCTAGLAIAGLPIAIELLYATIGTMRDRRAVPMFSAVAVSAVARVLDEQADAKASLFRVMRASGGN